MGFLDHTTNNIIVDAVLTDVGRSKLAQSGVTGGLNIVKYAFADNEVDYTLLKKYGETVGREKIEKNTPIFEANTDATAYYSTLIDYAVGSVPTISIDPDRGDPLGAGFSKLTGTQNFNVFFRLTGFPQGTYLIRFFYNSNVVAPAGTSSTYTSGLGNGVQQVKYCDTEVSVGTQTSTQIESKQFNKINDASFIGTKNAHITVEVQGYGTAAFVQVPVEFTS